MIDTSDQGNAMCSGDAVGIHTHRPLEGESRKVGGSTTTTGDLRTGNPPRVRRYEEMDVVETGDNSG